MSEPPRELESLLDATIGADAPQILPLLRGGEIEVHGRMPWSSNGTFLASVTTGADRVQAIYKPESTERPLWDFPAGLWRRELATYHLAGALGWPVVPPTVERVGPLGVGSLQLFIVARFEEHYFTLRDEERYRPRLHQLGVLDLLANNTDRKGGHVLVDLDDRVWGIDHGLNFHVEPKLRTVMWDWAGESIPATLRDDVESWLNGGGPSELAEWLDPDEVEAVRDRAVALVTTARFPTDPTGQRYPWPLI